MDEFTRECLAIDVAKRLTSEDVLERLSDLFVHRGVPEHIPGPSRSSPWRLASRSAPQATLRILCPITEKDSYFAPIA
jgi:hypothetical protein